MASYKGESHALDAEVLRIIEAWHRSGTALADGDFEDLALRIFAYQCRYNAPYARYAASLGFGASTAPKSWQHIPAVPAAAYKEATLATFDPATAALTFETSGTTGSNGGHHYMETRDLYDASLLAAFDRFMLPDNAALRYFNLVPNPADRPHSSLGYMMGRVSALRGEANTGWYVRGDDLLFEAFADDVRDAIAANEPICIAATAFALVHVVDTMVEREMAFVLPAGSRIMETGGFKGRSRILDRQELYAALHARFGIPSESILAEYSMTELSSQYYDDPRSRQKHAPPWLRVRVVGSDGATLPNGTVGALVHVDLANRSSCVAVATEDLGVAFDDGFGLIGRERGAALRGCSLDAETLLRR